MRPSVSIICLVLALACFVLAALRVPKVSWRDAGFAFIVVAYLTA